MPDESAEYTVCTTAFSRATFAVGSILSVADSSGTIATILSCSLSPRLAVQSLSLSLLLLLLRKLIYTLGERERRTWQSATIGGCCGGVASIWRMNVHSLVLPAAAAADGGGATAAAAGGQVATCLLLQAQVDASMRHVCYVLSLGCRRCCCCYCW